MDIDHEAVENLHHGHTAVGTTAVVLTNLDLPIYKGILLRCPGESDDTPNTATVYVGGPGVTADASATGGMPILPGTAIFLPVSEVSLVYLVSQGAAQDVAWMLI